MKTELMTNQSIRFNKTGRRGQHGTKASFVLKNAAASRLNHGSSFLSEKFKMLPSKASVHCLKSGLRKSIIVDQIHLVLESGNLVLKMFYSTNPRCEFFPRWCSWSGWGPFDSIRSMTDNRPPRDVIRGYPHQRIIDDPLISRFFHSIFWKHLRRQLQ